MRPLPPLSLLGSLLLFSHVAFAQAAAPESQLAPLPGAPVPPAPSPSASPPALPPSATAAITPSAAPPTEGAPAPSPPPDVAPPAPPAGAVESPVRSLRAGLRHDGFYFALGTGAGSVGLWGTGPNGSASMAGFGTTSTFAVGGTVARGLSLAGVIEGGMTTGTFQGGPQVAATTTHSVNGQTVVTQSSITGHSSANTFLLGLQIDWYPNPEDGWHAGAALGLGGASITDDANNTSGGISAAGSLFGGYQWWLGPSWSLGVMAVVTGAPTLKMSMSDSNQDDTGYRLTPLSVSLQSLLLYY